MPEKRPVRSGAPVRWPARLEYRFHAWRERRARRRGLTPTVAVFPGYGTPDRVRVLGRVLIAPLTPRRPDGEYASVRGFRSFLAVPIGYARVTVRLGGVDHEITADRGGVIDCTLSASLDPGWHTVTMTVEGGPPTGSRVFIVASDVRFGVVCDIDDTVMVTALPRPLVAAWNSFVVDEHARQPVPGMAVLLDEIVRAHPGAPIVYLSTGAWNVGPTLLRFLGRHLFPAGALLLTDWGPTHDRWFRSGIAHKEENLDRLAREFPDISWLLLGDDGQHDDAIYTAFTRANPDHVAAVAIRRLSSAEAMLAGGRTSVDGREASDVPWVTGGDGAALRERLSDVGVIPRKDA